MYNIMHPLIDMDEYIIPDFIIIFILCTFILQFLGTIIVCNRLFLTKFFVQMGVK